MSNNVRMSQLTRGLLSIAIVSAGVATTTYHNDAVAAVSAGRHNLGSTSTTNNRTTSSLTEVCVFCHTPHGADTSTAGAPLWNKKFTAGPFTPYSTVSPTLDAAFATDGLAGSTFLSGASLACLSCHDGTQAIDNLLNAPGSGGMSTGGGLSGLGWTWNTGTNSNLSVATGHLTGAPVLDKDLSNDHPIGIQYCGGGPRNTLSGTACVDGDFVSPSAAAVGTGTVWWVETNLTAGRGKNDIILYSRAFAVGNGPSVECASCHDVHSSNALFLRMGSNSNSQVCLACHVK